MNFNPKRNVETDYEDVNAKAVDIDSVVYLFKKKFWVIILITAIAGVLGVYKASQMKVSYQAVAKIFIMQGENKESDEDKNDYMMYYPQYQLEYYKSFMDTYSELINLGDYMEKTMEKYSTGDKKLVARGSFSFSASENAPIYTVTYRSGQEEEMQDVLSAVCKDFTEQVQKSLKGTDPQIIDSPKVYPVLPNRRRLVEIYVLVGLVLSIAVILVLDYLDDTVKNKGRLERILGVPVLGEIPKHDKGFKEEY